MVPAPSGGATVVTAFFPIPSKHSSQAYAAWLGHFLSLQDPMVVFTTAALAPTVRALRASHGPAAGPLEVVTMDLNDAKSAALLDDAGWSRQHALDPERTLHSDVRLYWIWLEKSHWLQRAAERNPFGSAFFCWVDAGFFRDGRFDGERLVRELPAYLGPEQVLLLDVASLVGGLPYAGGGFIGGFAAGVRRWHEAFYATLEAALAPPQGGDAGAAAGANFVGKDQPWMMRACLEAPGLCALASPVESFGDPWFFMAPLVHGDVSGLV
jgi:hypothetical protein